jgi:peptidoglycan/LPS O-acetylase OafA/YrhL
MEKSASKQSVPQARFVELESIRGLAALLVVIHHIPNWNSSFFKIEILRNSYLMVELFFVLSGFVIYRAYSENIKSGNDLLRFQFLRFGRLYPVHFLFLMLFLLLEILKYVGANYYGISSPNSVPFEENNFSAFIAHLFLAEGTGILNRVGSFNSPAWSISTEFYTYLIFGIIILKLYKWRVQSFIILLVVSYWLSLGSWLDRFDYMLTCLIGFSCGCLISVLISHNKKKLPGYAPIIPMIILIIFLSNYPVAGTYPLIFLISSAIIYTLVKSEDGAFKRILRFKLLTKLGEISYSLYMSHFLIIWVANQFIRVVLKRPNVNIDGKWFPQLALIEVIVAVIAIIVVTVFISILTHRFIERPFREKTRRIVSTNRFNPKPLII